MPPKLGEFRAAFSEEIKESAGGANLVLIARQARVIPRGPVRKSSILPSVSSQ